MITLISLMTYPHQTQAFRNNMRSFYFIVLITNCSFCLVNCDQKPKETSAHFTKADSLTDYYLSLQDSMLQTWNIMINDDNQKLRAMQNLLHELSLTHPEEQELYKSFEERLEQLARLRYTQKSMANADVIEEYDFASNSLINELITETEFKKEYAYNATMRSLVEQIRLADERVGNYRYEYDSLVLIFNNFIEKNEIHFSEADNNLPLEKKPAFQIASE